MTSARSRIAICVATYRRPMQLRRLLESLDRLDFGGTPCPDVSIVVVDNDPEGDTMGASQELESLVRWPLKLVHEPRRGIPYARNAAVREILDQVDLIAFVDDDETVSPSWLQQLLSGLEAFHADVVVGPVLPQYPPGTPRWMREGGFHARGSPAHGSAMNTAPTNNLLARMDVFRRLGTALFDESLALTGGSDTELFTRVSETGSSIIWVSDATVEEHLPHDRATARWIVRRAFRVAAVESLLLRRQNGLLSHALLARALRAVGHLAVGTLAVGTGIVRGPGAITRGAQRSARGAGSLAGLIGITGREYG